MLSELKYIATKKDFHIDTPKRIIDFSYKQKHKKKIYKISDKISDCRFVIKYDKKEIKEQKKELKRLKKELLWAKIKYNIYTRG